MSVRDESVIDFESDSGLWLNIYVTSAHVVCVAEDTTEREAWSFFMANGDGLAKVATFPFALNCPIFIYGGGGNVVTGYDAYLRLG